MTPQEKRRDRDLRKRYGITLDDFHAMMEHQGGVCAICGRPPKKNALHVDHDHKTGCVRGLLCLRCNRGLSWFSDNPDWLHNAGRYIENPPADGVIVDDTRAQY